MGFRGSLLVMQGSGQTVLAREAAKRAIATVGSVLTGGLQGLVVGLGFWITGLPNAAFWGVVTMVFAILPVVGSGLVWAPGAIALAIGAGSLPALLSTRLMVFGGQISFCVYMVHELVHTAWIWTAEQFQLTLHGTGGKLIFAGLLAILPKRCQGR